MRIYRLLFIPAVCLLVLSCAEKDFSGFRYPGGSPPYNVAEVFAPGFVSLPGRYEYPPAFLPSEGLMVFGAANSGGGRGLLMSRLSESGWGEPQDLRLTGFDEMEPVFMPGSSRLLFSADVGNQGKPHDIWSARFSCGGWKKPRRLAVEVNSPGIEYYASAAHNGNLYFTREGEGLFVAESGLIPGTYKKAVSLVELNEYNFCGHPFISPDESFILFDSREDGGYGSADIYISFREAEGWGTPLNLGDGVNSRAWEAMPQLSPDGRLLFFVRESASERDVYWLRFSEALFRRQQ